MKLLDKILLVYSALLAVTLTILSLKGGLTPQNLIMIALFLPVTGYIFYLIFRAYRVHKHFKQNVQKLTHTPQPPGFSLKAFFTQKDPFFIVTLCLFLSLVGALIVKTLSVL